MKQYKEVFFKIMIVFWGFFLHQEHRFRKIITYDVKFELKYNSFFPALSILMTWLSIFKYQRITMEFPCILFVISIVVAGWQVQSSWKNKFTAERHWKQGENAVKSRINVQADRCKMKRKQKRSKTVARCDKIKKILVAG